MVRLGGLRVMVLMGGTSAEHDVSVCSGLNVLDALDPERYEGVPVYVARDGTWHFGHRPEQPSLELPASGPPARSARSPAAGLPPAGGTLERLREAAAGVVFIALHGPGGEDGTVQGLLRLAGVPFTGPDVLASALAMDKVMTKRLLATVGIPVAAHRVVRAGEALDVITLAGATGLPCVVKPVAGGSSFGTRIVREAGDLEAAVEAALEQDDRVLIEAHVAGTEVTCAVLGGGLRERAEALPVTEIVPGGESFFDFRAKYTAGACEEITPARLPPAVTGEVQRLAVLAHETLGCEGMSRTDFIVGPAGPCLLETNTVPGLTRTSLLPQGAAAAGLSFAALLDRLIRSALLRAGRSA